MFDTDPKLTDFFAEAITNAYKSATVPDSQGGIQDLGSKEALEAEQQRKDELREQLLLLSPEHAKQVLAGRTDFQGAQAYADLVNQQENGTSAGGTYAGVVKGDDTKQS